MITSNHELQKTYQHCSARSVFLLLFNPIYSLLKTFFKQVYNDIKECLKYRKDLGLSKEQKIRLIATGVFLGFILAILYNCVLCGLILRLGHPLDSPLFPVAWFTDYTDVAVIIRTWNPYFCGTAVGSSYFPFGYFVFALFAFTGSNIGLFLYLGVFITLFLIINKYELKIDSKTICYLIVFSFLSYPFLFAVQRGNCEIYLFLFLWCFLYFFRKKKFKLSVLFLSFAIAMKLYPAVFIILFIKEKKYKEVILVVIYTVLITIICLSLFKGGFYNNINYILSGFDFIHKAGVGYSYFINNNVMQEGVSFYDFIKPILILTNGFSFVSLETHWFKLFYNLVCFIIALFAFFHILFIERVLWKNVYLLTALMLLLPFISAPYKLISLFLPLFLFINSQPDKKDFFYSILFILLLIPTKYWCMMGIMTDGGPGLSISVFITPILIVVMSFMIFREGMRGIFTVQGKISIIRNLTEYFKKQ